MRPRKKLGSRGTGSEQKVMVIVPAYNEESYLSRTIDALKSWREEKPKSREFVIINDGSSDGTSSLVKSRSARLVHIDELSSIGKRFKGNKKHRHMGKARAIRRGFELARKEGADVVVMLDAELDNIHKDKIDHLVKELNMRPGENMVVAEVHDDVGEMLPDMTMSGKGVTKERSGQRAIRTNTPALYKPFGAIVAAVGYEIEPALNSEIPRHRFVDVGFKGNLSLSRAFEKERQEMRAKDGLTTKIRMERLSGLENKVRLIKWGKGNRCKRLKRA